MLEPVADCMFCQAADAGPTVFHVRVLGGEPLGGMTGGVVRTAG